MNSSHRHQSHLGVMHLSFFYTLCLLCILRCGSDRCTPQRGRTEVGFEAASVFRTSDVAIRFTPASAAGARPYKKEKGFSFQASNK